MTLRVALDLDGSLEPLGNSMTELADALDATGDINLVRFHTTSRPGPTDVKIPGRRLWSPWWERGRGPAVTRWLPPVDVVHVAGAAVPPVTGAALLVSVDDLRPLRERSGRSGRAHQLRRAVEHGAVLVASSRAARHELTDVLGLERPQVVVGSPAVPSVDATTNGADLVVNATGATRRLLDVVPTLRAVASRHHARVIVLSSTAQATALRRAFPDLDVVSRDRGRAALARARVVFHVADGARFPSLAVAALSAGVPTVASASEMSREILRGAAALVGDDDNLADVLEDVWSNDARRAVMQAAGRDRARDFAAPVVARRYRGLYEAAAQFSGVSA